MRAGLTTSVILHAVALGFGLLSLKAPSAFDVSDVEALPVDIVPVSALTQIQEGDKKATMRDKPAPTPTKRPDIVADAQKTGDNSVDTDKPPTPEAKAKPVQTSSAPPPAPTPVEKPREEDVPKPKEAPKPPPATEVAPQPQPNEQVKPDRVQTKGGETADWDKAADATSTQGGDKAAAPQGGQQEAREDELLDEGLEETFPASDPVSAKHIT